MRATLLTLALVFVATFPANAQSRAERLMVGTWDCRYSGVLDGSRVRVRTLSSYQSSGRSFGDFTYRMTLQGTPLVMNGFMTGRWALRDGNLLERSTSVVISDLSLARFDLPARDRAELSSFIKKQGAVGGKIVRLNRRHLVVRQGEDVQYRCTRVTQRPRGTASGRVR